ncbi:MAG: FKBP-type peptidyl-prolyl cis-trans isomerase, partial [Aquihabitans sp.]
MSLISSRRLFATVLVASVILAGCGSADEIKGEAAKDGLSCQPARVEPTKTAPKVALIDGKAPTELETEDLTDGEGCGIDRLPYVSLNLVGITSDGTEFVNTWDDERPVTVTIGSGELVAGLETGLSGLKVGGRRQITVPADLAYGEAGNEAQGIGPDETLRFVVDLVAIDRNRTYCRAAQPLPEGTVEGKPETVELPVESPVELVTDDIEAGTGNAVEEGNWVSINYIGVSCASGAQFDSSWDRGETFDFTVGEGTISGMADGVVGMKKGGMRRIEIPSHEGYGVNGNPPDIATDDPLVFLVELLDVKDTPPATTTTAPAD